MSEKNVQNAFFIGIVLLVTVAFLWLVRGFLQPIFWAAALAIVFYPLFRRTAELTRGRRSLAGLLTVLAIVLIVILPCFGLAVAVTGEATALYQRIDSGDIDLREVYESVSERIPQLEESLRSIGIDPAQIREQLSSFAVVSSRFVATRLLQFGQNALRITVLGFVMLYLLFFFLKDGPKLLEAMIRAMPIGDARERRLLARFAEVSRATIKGSLVVGAVQGLIGGLTFWMLGVTGAVLWGAIMGLLSLLPAVGPPLVWVPAAILLFVNGRPGAAIVLILVGTLVIGLVDNLLRPLLVGRDTRMPDYLILLSTLGGIAAFGLSGIVIGPIIAALFLTVWEMFEAEYSAKTDVASLIEAVKADPDDRHA